MRTDVTHRLLLVHLIKSYWYLLLKLSLLGVVELGVAGGGKWCRGHSKIVSKIV